MKWRELPIATIDGRWNQKFRGPIAPIHDIDFTLPEPNRRRLVWLEQKTGANAEGLIYAGGVFDLRRGEIPKDFDTYVVSNQHPLLAMFRVAVAALCEGHKIGFYDHRKKGIGKTIRVTLAWKRMKLFCDGQKYDIGFLQAPFNLRDLADESDIGVCAIGATKDVAFASERHLQDMQDKAIVFRSMLGDARNRRRHPERLQRYGVEKCAGWTVRYQDPADAVHFAPELKRLGLS